MFKTDHAETVQISYDPQKVSLQTLLEYLFNIIDPTSIDRQGNDSGRQYRTGIYFKDEEDDEIIKASLTDTQFKVTQQNSTEPPFQNEYWDSHARGIYVDIVTGEPLFVSSDKFDSGCGWPSFSKPLSDELIVKQADNTHVMVRSEVRSRTGDSHLGHVFTDGSKPEGLRYCINSASLKFIPLEDMQKTGYGHLTASVI